MSYKEEVLAVFVQLCECSWPKFLNNDFWHTANTLDTCVDFIIEGSNAWPDWKGLFNPRPRVQKMIEDSYAYFREVYKKQLESGPGGPVWWDDYGWWGITFTKIYQNYPTLFQVASVVTREQCLQVALDCWTLMNDYSQGVNQRLKPKSPKDPKSPYQGPVEGGCWNHNPEEQGIQNTVTNALFLVLSGRLFQNTNDKAKKNALLKATASQYLWFRNWYVKYFEPHKAECPTPPGEEQRGLFRCLMKQEPFWWIVVYERAHDPAKEYKNYNQGNPAFRSGQLWSGDQGLLLGGLAAVLAAKDEIAPLVHAQDANFPASAKAMALSLYLGTSGLRDPSYVFHEAELLGGFLGFAADYATGKGVLIRYFSEAAKIAEKDPKDYIVANAGAVVADESKNCHQVSFRWNDQTNTTIRTNESCVAAAGEIDRRKVSDGCPDYDPRFKPTAQSAGLDALNAAIRYLKDK